MDAPAIEVIDVHRRFGEAAALRGVRLSVRRGEFFSLLGPSGCGKTTLLRLIAGLDVPDAGSILLRGRDVAQVPAHRRPVNTVFQSYALFPQLRVRDNIAFGLRMKRLPKAEIGERVDRILDTVQIRGLEERFPHQLSGGQKQRVALARALVNEPEVLLLDEPLGALDVQLRKQLQAELRALQRRLGITFLYVTHDQEEALSMSDRLAVMNAGVIEQVGGVVELYERPRSRFVARFLGSCNLIEGTLRGTEGPIVRAQTALGELEISAGASADEVPGSRRTLAIRPEKIVLASRPGTGPNQISAIVREVLYRGADIQSTLDTAAGVLEVRWLNRGERRDEVRPGQVVSVQLPPEALIILES